MKLTATQTKVLIAYRDNISFNARPVVVNALLEKGLLERNPTYVDGVSTRYYRITEAGRQALMLKPAIEVDAAMSGIKDPHSWQEWKSAYEKALEVIANQARRIDELEQALSQAKDDYLYSQHAIQE